MLAEGSRSAREWVETNFASARGSEMWIEMWDKASLVDIAVAEHDDDASLMARLASDDNLDTHLRRMASAKYKNRTGDRVGSQAMLVLKPPGASTDIAPSWLVQEVTLHSKFEHQRNERVAAATKIKTTVPPRAPPNDGDGGGKGKWKGKDKGRGRGQGAAA